VTSYGRHTCYRCGGRLAKGNPGYGHCANQDCDLFLRHIQLPEPLDGDYDIDEREPEQLAITELTPQPGTLWRNIHDGRIAVIVHLDQRRRTWVKVRRDGRLTDMPLSALLEHYRPHEHPVPTR
jgi:hypothetical protein